MGSEFSKIFHDASKIRSGGPKNSSDTGATQPDEWRTTYYKTYPRMPRIELPDYFAPTELFSALKQRQSRRDFTRGVVSRQELGTVLKYSAGNMSQMLGGRYRRAQPSGGARFPIELYPIVFRDTADIVAGFYHYHVRDHALETIWHRPFSDDDIAKMFSYPWVKDASIALVMTGIFWRSQNKYGERGYRHVLLEAGHIGQNIYLIAEALRLKACALSGTRDEHLETLLEIDGITESVVYAFAVGK